MRLLSHRLVNPAAVEVREVQGDRRLQHLPVLRDSVGAAIEPLAPQPESPVEPLDVSGLAPAVISVLQNRFDAPRMVVHCFGENGVAKHSPCTREADFSRPRNTLARAKALSRRELRILAGRLAQEGRNSSGAGATPPENGPGLRRRAFRRGRSWESSLQEGGGGPACRRGVHRRHPDHCHRSPSWRPAKRARIASSATSVSWNAPSTAARESCVQSQPAVMRRRPAREIPSCWPDGLAGPLRSRRAGSP